MPVEGSRHIHGLHQENCHPTESAENKIKWIRSKTSSESDKQKLIDLTNRAFAKDPLATSPRGFAASSDPVQPSKEIFPLVARSLGLSDEQRNLDVRDFNEMASRVKNGTIDPLREKETIKRLAANTDSFRIAIALRDARHYPILFDVFDSLRGVSDEEKNKWLAAINNLIKISTNEQIVEIIKAALKREINRCPLTDSDTLLRGDSTTTRLTSWIQIKLLTQNLDQKLKELVAILPNRNYEIEAGDREREGLKNTLHDVLVKLHDLSQDYPQELRQINTFLKNEVGSKFGPQKGEMFASQLFFLRFLNPVLVGGLEIKILKLVADEGKLKSFQPKEGQSKAGMQIGIILQKMANNMPLKENEQFLQNYIDSKEVKELMHAIVRNINLPEAHI